MYSHEIEIRVRYAETDKMGYVYYGRYCEYLEMARTQSIRSLGVSYRSLEDDMHIALPVLKVDMKYIRPAYYDDVLTLKTTLKELPGSRITFHTEIFKEGDLINISSVTLCFVDSNTGRPTKPPSVIIDALKPYFE